MHLDSFPRTRNLCVVSTKHNFLCSFSHVTRGMPLFHNFVLGSSSVKPEQCRGPVCISKAAVVSTLRQRTGKSFRWPWATTALYPATHQGRTQEVQRGKWDSCDPAIITSSLYGQVMFTANLRTSLNHLQTNSLTKALWYQHIFATPIPQDMA